MIIGLTGSFGTGKSFVAGIFGSLGAKVLDADKIAHDALKKDGPVYRKVLRTFGPQVLGPGRNIDRRKLGKIVFSDKALLRKLNSIVHPEVIKVLKRNIADSSGRVVIIDAPLLLEARLGGLVDALIVVKCPKDEQVSRCMKKFGMKKEEVLSRMRSQMSLAKKIKMADHVVDNKGPKAETRVAVKKIWRQIAWR